MEFQQMRYFVKLAEYSSFSRAASQLYVTQPMLTRSLKALENELGTELIERTSRSFRLTDTGKLFYRQTKEILEKYDDIYRSIEDIKSNRTGQVKMSIPGVLIDVYFAPLLTQFSRDYPGIDVSIIEEGSKDTVKTVLDGNADLGLVMLPIESSAEMNVRVVINDVAHLVVNKNHSFVECSVVPVERLRHESIITFGVTTTLHDEFLKLCAEHGFVPRLSYKTLMTNFTMEMVATGQCIALLPAPVSQHFLIDGLTTRPLDPPLIWNIAIIYKKSRYCSYATMSPPEYN